jgi:hypothetical protein
MTTQAVPPSPYELKEQPDGSAYTARENLEAILERELVGPLYGDDEVISVAPDTAYPLGRIAPSSLTPDDKGETDGPEDNEDLGPDEDGGEDAAPKRGLMIPASMGLRFQIPNDLAAFTVHASWGKYHSRNVEGEKAEDGRVRREFVRTPMDAGVHVQVAELSEGTTRDYPLADNAVLRVDIYKDGDRHLVEIALCNDAEVVGRIPVKDWLFQAKLTVEAGDQAVFLPVRDALIDTQLDEFDSEANRLTLQYRDRLEFAIGRTCSATWYVEDKARRANKVWTTWVPSFETPQTQAGANDDVITDMAQLATATDDELRAGLEPINASYAAWLDDQEAEANKLPDHLRSIGLEAVTEARRAAKRLTDGINFLLGNPEALQCFRFMNQVMADQRVHSEIVLRRSRDKSLSADSAAAAVAADGAKAHSWRMFQLAFVLIQIPAMCDPTHKYRSDPGLARVELLFFPTGGGKTEAYLGLAAFTFAIRRRQGVVASTDGHLDGNSGLAVLMRYTLRLLTAQQFQRASTMVCAAELERRKSPATWGEEPFRIGLWVGSNVAPKWVKDADEQLKSALDSHYDHGLTVLQVKRCPWCGTPIGKQNLRIDLTVGRVFVRCGDQFATCPFSEGGQVDEGLPILTTDEEIYRLAPAFVIATVDKFARLAREGQSASLFGYVSKKCDRHGYVHPDYSVCDIKDGSKHPAKNGHAAAGARACGRLRPPDLIIQDELHLITGALGTTVGLFEAAIDTLCSWTTTDAEPVSPLIVASSATVRNASEQVRSLYGRKTAIFPPQVLDAADTYFSTELPVSRKHPGRRYVGVCASGVRLTAAEIRIAEVLMAGGQLLLDTDPGAADPYLTLVGYFNATRELAGMTRFMQDDVQTALERGRPWSKLPRRYGAASRALNIAELTARVSSSAITNTLDQMAVPFDPTVHTTSARVARLQAFKDGKKTPDREQVPFDAVLATSMLQVGVDVPRLGLMLIVGQPKNTAEYIQASSRVGRSADGPGLVVTLGNWARPRDLAHFEQFQHYHDTFYAQVEALSVTPYSITAIERGIEGVLVSAARVISASEGADGLSPEKGAERVELDAALLTKVASKLVERCRRASDDSSAKVVKDRLTNRIAQWKKRRSDLHAESKTLVYERITKGAGQGPLMISAEASTNKDVLAGAPFVVPNSMREVQPEINLLVTPDPARLFMKPPASAPGWAFPADEED